MIKRRLILIGLFLCLLTSTVFASTDWYTNSEDTKDISKFGDSKRTTSSSKNNIDKQDIYDTKLGDIKDIPSWLNKNKSFVVVRKSKSGNTKVYVNVPNVQQLLKVSVLGYSPTGWENQTYTPEDNIIKNVGENDNNIINKFGYNIPVNRYAGESPSLIIEPDNFVPTTIRGKIKALVDAATGGSFIKAPDKENYNDLKYLGHEYVDSSSEKHLIFIQNYWNTFKNSISEEADISGGLASAALKEYDEQQGKKGGKKYKSWYGTDADWCGMFVSYCVFTAGYADKGELKKFGALAKAWKKPKLSNKCKWTYSPASSAKPQKGDIVVFKHGHVGIVVEVEGNKIQTVEGNTNTRNHKNSDVGKHKYSMSNDDIDGYCRLIKNSEESASYENKNTFTGNNISISAKEKIPQNQCLLSNADGNCVKTVAGTETSVSVKDLYFESGAFKIDTGRGKLTRAQAIKVMNTLQSYLGPTYSEAMSNLMTIMEQRLGDKYKTPKYLDPRVMPYDIDLLQLDQDKKDITVRDPRVEIYNKTNTFGGLVNERINLKSVFNQNTLMKPALKVIGLFSKGAVVVNQLTNFEVIDNLGLSPAKLWKSAPATLAMLLLMCLFVFKLVKMASKFLTGNGVALHQVLITTFFFACMLGLVTMFTIRPDRTWNTIKKVGNVAFNAGETITVEQNGNVSELFGDNIDSSVTYYLPYFNAWTEYNTGYPLLAKEQQIDKKSNAPEVDSIKLPKLNGKETQLWAVVLADSFNQKGENGYGANIENAATNTEATKNGMVVNTNAYRAVDHFIAPRLTSKSPKDGKLNITNTINENYNGHFQNMSFFSTCAHIITAFNMFLIALIKCLIFYYFVYMLFMLIYNLILAVGARTDVRKLFKNTFFQLIYITLWGTYAGLVILLNSASTDLLAFAFSVGLLSLTFTFVRIMKSFPDTYPASLKIVGNLVDKAKGKYTQHRRMRGLRQW